MNVLLLVAMILEAVFGLGFTLIPAFMLTPFGISADANLVVMSRLFGTALIGLAVVLWYVRGSKQPDVKKGSAYGFTAYYLLSGIVMLMAVLGGQMNPLGWSMVVLHAVLAIWFGYFLFR
ncbi:MAG: hypothetical protein ACYC6L_03225 [Anaerolineae bacterium]